MVKAYQLNPLLMAPFMIYIETKIPANRLIINFIYRYRYVDDIIAYFNGTQRLLDAFVNLINVS